jgi:hypothetical protein
MPVTPPVGTADGNRRVGGFFLEQLLAAGGPERVELQGKVLLLRGQARVADQHGFSRNSSRGDLVGQPLSRHGFRMNRTEQICSRAGGSPRLR